jgi:leucyl-tRNA synthetase
MVEELWEQLGGKFSVHQQRWPTFDPQLAADETLSIGIQINGKLRARIDVAASADEEAVRQQAFASPEVQQHLADKQVVKSFYVPGRLLNVVVK